MLVIFSVSGYIVCQDSIKKTRRNLTQQATAFAKLSTKPLAEAYELYFDSGYYKFREIFRENKDLDSSIKKIQIINVNGKVILDSGKIGDSSYLGGDTETVDKSTLDKVTSADPTYEHNQNNASELTEIFYPYFSDWGSHPYTVRYFVSYDQIRSNIITIIEQTVLLFIVSFFIVVFAITSSVNRFILSPIKKVSELAQRISRGKYGERIKIKTNDEIEDLAGSTNKMARKLEQDIIDLRELDKLKDEFIDVAAHNFKAPLNHLKFDIAYLIQHVEKK